MGQDNAPVAAKLRRWEKYLHEYRLPKWDEIPDLGLYMEQVLVLLKQCLDYLPPELKEEQFITAATINNYVRGKYMPEPVKKKYYRVHLAYLIIICTLKQSLSIATLVRLIPMGLREDEVRRIYDAYVERHHLAAEHFIEQIRLLAGPILGHEQPQVDAAADDKADLIFLSAIIGGFSRLLAEKLLLLPENREENE